MLSELGLVLLLALVNGFFALSEIAMVAARKSRLRALATRSRRAAVALRLVEHPERFLPTVQVGITLLAIITGVVTGASIGQRLSIWLATLGLPWLAAYALPLGLILSISLITFINIVVGELVPKRAALVAPERLAVLVALPMLVLGSLTAPFVWILNAASSLLLRLLRLDRASREQVSEEEIRLLVAESAEQGVLDEDERNMVSRVLRLGDRTVDSVMTPRPRIAWLDAAASLAENLAVLHATPYSRYPVYRHSESEVLGVLEVKSLLQGIVRGEQPADLFRVLVKPLYVPASARAFDLLEEFRDAETPLALVVDEYGDIEGLVTLNNLLEAVVGKSMPAEGASAARDAPIVRRDDGSYLVDGALATDDLRELLAIEQLPNEEDHDFRTVAGMMMAAFGRIPQAGESFNWHGMHFEVLDLDGARIDKVLVAPPAAAGTAED